MQFLLRFAFLNFFICSTVQGQLGSLRCGQVSRNKRLVVESPSQLPTTCTYTIEAINNYICQLLIQFERFNLQQPRQSLSELTCEDRFIVGDHILCGSNNGQHLYIRFPAYVGNSNKRRQISMTFQLPSRWPQSSWRLTITQLECLHNSDLWRLSNLPGLAFFENLQNTARNMFPSPSYGDLDIIAPPGCDQYFTQSSGTIRSFNFNATSDTLYMPNSRYVICVKGKSDSKQIEYNVRKFSLSIASTSLMGFDSDCHTTVVTFGRQEDYLMIPRSSLLNLPNYMPTYYCGRSIENYQVIASSPFFLYFKSDNIADPNETGFSIDYTVK